MPEAGWYLDPKTGDPTSFRYWDGASWTRRISDGNTIQEEDADAYDSLSWEPPHQTQALQSVLARKGRDNYQAWRAESQHMSATKRLVAAVAGGVVIILILLGPGLTPGLRVLLFPNALLVVIGVANPPWHRTAAHLAAWPLILGSPLLILAMINILAWTGESPSRVWLTVVPTAVVALSIALHGRRPR